MNEKRGGRETAGNGDRFARQLRGLERRSRHDQRTAATPEGPPASKQAIPIAKVAIRMKGHLDDVRLTGQRDPIERVDVLEALDDGRGVLEPAFHPRREDESAVWTGGIRQDKRSTKLARPMRIHHRFSARRRATA